MDLVVHHELLRDLTEVVHPRVPVAHDIVEDGQGFLEPDDEQGVRKAVPPVPRPSPSSRSVVDPFRTYSFTPRDLSGLPRRKGEWG